MDQNVSAGLVVVMVGWEGGGGVRVMLLSLLCFNSSECVNLSELIPRTAEGS